MAGLKIDTLPLNNIPNGALIRVKGFIDSNTAPDIEKIIETRAFITEEEFLDLYFFLKNIGAEIS